jgi:hypothetical protein
LSSSERRQGSLAPPGVQRGLQSNERSDLKIAQALGFARKLALTLPNSSVGLAALRLAASLSSRLAQMRESGELGNQKHREEKDA